MARTVKDARLDSRAAREKLPVQHKPHWRTIEQGRHLGYYKGPSGGTWIARHLVNGTYREAKLARTDDVLDSNSVDVLSFAQAQAKARAWFEAQARAAQEALSPAVVPLTVAEACADYFKGYEQRGRKDATNLKLRIARITAEIGNLEVSALTYRQVRDWHSALASSPRRVRQKKGDTTFAERPAGADDTDAMRRRQASANRMLTVLKAALNYAVAHQNAAGTAATNRNAWTAVKPFPGVDVPRIRYLSDAEARRLVNASPPDFRQMARAALLTGCRYGELCRMVASDFNAEARVVTVAISKSGKPRAVHLSDEGLAFFREAVAGKAAGALAFVRADGNAWATAHQGRRMVEACRIAGISPTVSFHILRHTYGARLAMAGAPMGVIAAQLGHADTRMTERHYAHLAPSYVATAFRAAFGDLGLGGEGGTVIPIAM